MAWAVRRVAVRVAAVNAAALVLGLSGFERWLALRPGSPWAEGSADTPVLTPGYIRPDAVTGFGPARGIAARSDKRHEGRLVYDVTYTIGADRFRVTPPPLASPPAGTVLVFGCSFAFGEGVDDRDTFPWRLSELTGRRWEVRNEAFHGWGPHQMLSLLESGRALGAVPARAGPVVAIYEALADHVPRALGRRPWSRGTPRYVRGPDGVPVREGSFDEPPASVPAAFRADLSGSLERWITFRRLLGSERRVADADVALVASLVARSRDLVRRADPGARFVVLFWDEEDPLSSAYRAAIAARGIEVRDVSALLPGYPRDRRGWQLPLDGHPTPAANAVFAAWGARLLPGAGVRPGP